MPYCRNCGGEVGDADAFCAKCSAPQVAKQSNTAPAAVTRVLEQPTLTTRTNGLAIASLVLAIVWLAGVGSLFAVVLGFIALRHIRRSAGTQSGNGLAIAGIIVGFVGIIATLVFALLVSATVVGVNQAVQQTDDQIAQSSLRNTFTAAKAIYAGLETYEAANVLTLAKTEPSLTFVGSDQPSPDPNTVSFSVLGPGTFVAATYSNSGTCWFIRDTVGDSRGLTWNRIHTDSGSCRARSTPPNDWLDTPSG